MKPGESRQVAVKSVLRLSGSTQPESLRHSKIQQQEKSIHWLISKLLHSSVSFGFTEKIRTFIYYNSLHYHYEFSAFIFSEHKTNKSFLPLPLVVFNFEVYKRGHTKSVKKIWHYLSTTKNQRLG